MKGCKDGNEKSDCGMEQDLPWLQHWAQISRFLYRGCMSHNAYVEVYGSDEPSPNKSKVTSDDN
jgi:hypothetical protein